MKLNRKIKAIIDAIDKQINNFPNIKILYLKGDDYKALKEAAPHFLNKHVGFKIEVIGK